MPQFIRRKGANDLEINPYYNDPKYVGKGGYYKDNPSYYCVNWIGRVCEISETRVTYFGDDEPPQNTMFNRKGYGDACEWYTRTLWNKTTKANEVKVGDVVCYGTAWGNGYGHIRVVEGIYDDYLICSGANEDGKGSVRFDIRIDKNDGGGDNATGLMGYIHNPHITNEQTTDFDKIINDLTNSLSGIKSELTNLKIEGQRKDEIIKADKEAFKEIEKKAKDRL